MAKTPNLKIPIRTPKRVSAFRKYTNLAALIHLLQTKQITLLNPSTWDDKNDAYFLEEFKNMQGFTTVLAICFAETDETYHHWKVFSDGVDGVCLEFDKEKVLSAFDGNPCISKGPVNYRLIASLRKRDRINPEELPFLKRKPYEPECEYRVVYADKDKVPKPSLAFDIEIGWINRITLSPWMHASLRKSLTSTLRSIKGCEKLKITRSTLVGNREWQSLADKARLPTTS